MLRLRRQRGVFRSKGGQIGDFLTLLNRARMESFRQWNRYIEGS